MSGLTGKTLALPAFSQNSTIRIAGWSAGEASQLRLGQFFSIGAQLFRIVAAPVSAAADGTCDVEFEPRIRTTVAQGAVVVFNAPVGLFRLIGTEDVGYTLGVDGADFGSMSAIEAVF
ncbi:hypothetical protein [Sphingomonas guangdongensis]|uniref:hypothetical protein n=1 Tax=Sphingomonas guangdongensis TaxID=1141890 RepID=UPI000BE47045|nr:hypothetical protein [Sphingomonas guangdongensis]